MIKTANIHWCSRQNIGISQMLSVAIDFHSIFSYMEVNGCSQLFSYQCSSKHLLLCSTEEKNSYRFGETWGWVNDDRLFIFGWTVPLRARECKLLNMMIGGNCLCLKIFFSTALQKLHKILTYILEDKIRTIYSQSSCANVYTHLFLMHCVPSWASVNVFSICNSCVWVPQLSPVWKDGTQNHAV